MTRYLSQKIMTIIAFYFLLAFLFTTNEASKKNFERHKTNIGDLNKSEMIFIINFFTLREALGLRFVSKLLEKSIPEITGKNVNYFKPFLNHGYDKNIGLIVSKYCSTLNHDAAEELQIINENIHLIEAYNIFHNSCVFALNLKNRLMLYGGIGECKETVPIKFMKGVPNNIKVDKRVIIGIIITNDGPKCFTVGDPNFYTNDVPEKIKQEILATRPTDDLIPMCTANIFSFWNRDTQKLYSWGTVDHKNEIPPPEEILENVDQVEESNQAICILFRIGTVTAWGNLLYGGKIPETMKPLLKNIRTIESTEGAFAAVSHDGKVFAWGHPLFGGEIPQHIQPLLHNIPYIESTKKAFAAWAFKGNAFAWGDPNYGGNPSEEIQAQLYNVEGVYATHDRENFVVSFIGGGKPIMWP